MLIFNCCILFIGLVTQVPQEFFSFLQEIQSKLAKVIKSVGKIEHALYPKMIYNIKMCWYNFQWKRVITSGLFPMLYYIK